MDWLHTWWTILLIFSIAPCILLLIAAIFYTPKAMRVFALFVVKGSLSSVLEMLAVWAIMPTFPLPVVNKIAPYAANGIAQQFGELGCYICFTAFVYLSYMNCMLIMLCFGVRYFTIKTQSKISLKTGVFLSLLAHLPSIFIGGLVICTFVHVDTPFGVEYIAFGVDMSLWQNTVGSIIQAGMWFASILVSLILRSLTVRALATTRSQVSQSTQRLQKSMIKTLTVLLSIPCLGALSAAVYMLRPYIPQSWNITDARFITYGIMCHISALIPLISIKPYRNGVLRFGKQTSTVNPSVTPGSR